MGKQAAERRLDDTEASAFLRALRTSPRKLNLVAQTIRGKDAAKALAELTFSRRRIAHDVKKVLRPDIYPPSREQRGRRYRRRARRFRGD